ncbi:hypothetical protein CVT25_015373 [Psilocybe cyanescens]|uniref:protein-tyrosine-phosphatase n=1 Tax=Psilocybe cyanescens TaxID=93625 RepID=A0A409WH86_PSICY|nr:hypothetical protein CVT25_015373 [Psilocybe cyanescens]
MVEDATTTSPGTKRVRPPKIDLAKAIEKKGPAIQLERDSPILHISEDEDDDDDNDVFEDTMQLSDSDSSNTSSPTGRTGPSIKLLSSDEDPLPDDITKDLEALQQLRQSVKKNLRLRPIRSRSDLRKVDLDLDLNLDSVISRSAFTASASPGGPLSALSPTSSIASSYFTPASETPHSALFSAAGTRPHPPPPFASPLPTGFQTAPAVSAQTLYTRLLQPKRPLLIDTRPLAAHQSFHLRHSINIAIPSLILKRCRRPGGGLQSLDALRQFTTTEQGKMQWDSLMCPGGPWDGDVVVYDDEMDPKDKDNLGITAWAIIPVIAPLLSYGSIAYLEGGISLAGHHPDLQTLITTVDDLESISAPSNPTSESTLAPPATASRGGMKRGAGLLQLDTQAAFRSKRLPEIEPASSTSSKPPSPSIPRSPLPMMSSTMSSSSSRGLSTAESHHMDVVDASPSPPPSSIGFRRPAPPRRPNAHNLRRIDTKSAERLGPPKLSVRTKQMRSATLAVPPTLSLSIQPPQSPSHLNLIYSNHSPPSSARYTPMTPSNDPSNYLTPYYTPPHTPGTPKPFLPPSPVTARPDLDPPTTEEAFPVFTISTILPNFLFLGPELTTPEHVAELQALGVKRILNIAAECDDDHGLKLREVFDKYYKIPMRDTVEEENIAKGVREVCDILGEPFTISPTWNGMDPYAPLLHKDDARLHSAATYVHCKAGKSRSVTAVMAYLIHANHWTLSSAYAFVLERRKGISPNIGFVSELMNFEEQELGGKSVGVQPTLSSNHSHPGSGASVAEGGTGIPGGIPESYVMASGSSRRGAHVRESLPPMDNISGLNSGGGPMSAGGLMDRVMGDSGQEMEIKDSYGRYRHARRAPVDETTLQPLRRVSKAGLESSSYA